MWDEIGYRDEERLGGEETFLVVASMILFIGIEDWLVYPDELNVRDLMEKRLDIEEKSLKEKIGCVGWWELQEQI